MAKDIPVNFSYKDKGFAAIAARLDSLTARVNGRLAGLSKFNKSMESLGKSFSPMASFAKGAAVGVGLLLAQTAGLGAGLKGALDAGGRFSDLSSRTGAAVSDLVVMEQAFKNNGVAAEQVGPAINKLQKALGGVNEDGEPTNDTLTRLGLNMNELQNASPVQQFQMVGKAINQLKSPTERAAAAMALFGKSGGELNTLFADANAFTDAAAQVGEQAKVLEANAALFDDISDKLGLAGLKMQGLFVGVAEQVAPVLKPLMDWFSTTDFLGVGRQFGSVIAQAIQAMTDGSIWGVLLSSAQLAIGEAVNYLWRGLQGVLALVGRNLLSLIDLAITAFTYLAKPEFWKGVGSQLMALVNTFNSAFYAVFAHIVEKLQPLLGKVGLGGAADSAAKGLRGAQDASGQAAATFQGMAGEAFTPLAGGLFEEWAAKLGDGIDAFAKAFENGSNLLDLSSLQGSLDSQVGAIADKVGAMQIAALNKGGEKKNTAYLDPASETKSRPSGSRLLALTGFGLFVKDPLASEARLHTKLLSELVKNTKPENKPKQPPTDPTDLSLRFF